MCLEDAIQMAHENDFTLIRPDEKSVVIQFKTARTKKGNLLQNVIDIS